MRFFLRWLALPLVAGVSLIGIQLCTFSVDRAEYVYLTQFGRHVATYDGAVAADAGLHWKWPAPIQTVHRLDNRLQVFDLPSTELPTSDVKGQTIDKMLTLDAFVCWRIADKDSVDRFLRTVGTPERAQAILTQHISSELGAAISKMELEDLISTQEGRVDQKRETLRQRLLRACGSAADALGNRAGRDYGMEVVDIRLRRANHPPQVRDAIFARIISERERRVADYQSAGVKQAAEIKSKTDKEVADLMADAGAEERRIKGEADTRADRIRNAAHGKDVEFYTFLKTLETYKSILGDNKTMLLLSTHREMFRLMFDPPAPVRKPVTFGPSEDVPSREGNPKGGK
jgi:modulator of FtsH protease HflC